MLRLRLGLLVGALPLLLWGCSGTPFGEGLSRSFSPAGAGTPPPSSAEAASDGPAGPGTAPTPTALAGTAAPGGEPSAAARPAEGPSSTSPTAPGKPAPGKPAPASTPASASPGVPGSRGTAVPPTPPVGPASRPSAVAPGPPVPYRVTLRLPAADPAAPAEGVTQALRAAGVPFEVETIERLPRNGPSNGPTPPASSAAPAPATPPPQSRPAPAPR